MILLELIFILKILISGRSFVVIKINDTDSKIRSLIFADKICFMSSMNVNKNKIELHKITEFK